MNSPCLVSVVHLAYFVDFGGFQVFVVESYDKHLENPQNRRNRPNGQQKPGKVSSFT